MANIVKILNNLSVADLNTNNLLIKLATEGTLCLSNIEVQLSDEIKSVLIPENIKEGVTILGVTGTCLPTNNFILTFVYPLSGITETLDVSDYQGNWVYYSPNVLYHNGGGLEWSYNGDYSCLGLYWDQEYTQELGSGYDAFYVEEGWGPQTIYVKEGAAPGGEDPEEEQIYYYSCSNPDCDACGVEIEHHCVANHTCDVYCDSCGSILT